MEEGLWQINPNLIKNIKYYVSIMPYEYRAELIEYTYIEPSMSSQMPIINNEFTYTDWVEYNFDEDYNVRQSLPLMGEERLINEYYFLLFFLSAFKRSPENVESVSVTKWIVRCLIDVWKIDPSITPYYSSIKVWKFDGSEEYWKGLMEIYNDKSGNNTISINTVLRARGSLGLGETQGSGLYELFISPVFNLSKKDEVFFKNGKSHLISPSFIDRDAYWEAGVNEYLPATVKKSYTNFLRYWQQYDGVIPIGFLSRKEGGFRLLNYNWKTFQNLK